jgi:hypothetical protein
MVAFPPPIVGRMLRASSERRNTVAIEAFLDIPAA